MGPRTANRALLLVLVIVLIRFGALRGHGAQHGSMASRPRARPFWAGLGVRDLGASAHRAQLGYTDVAEGRPRLVTSGPYHLVRHPIYTGILLAGVGTAAALSWFWLILVALAGVYFVYSATVEERNMAKQFPETYPAYRRSTKMLVPFVF